MKKALTCAFILFLILSCQLPESEINLSPEGISYLQENAIELSLDTELNVPTELFSNKKIILTGEAHYDIDARIMNYQWIVYFHNNMGIRHYISEFNWYQANVINNYINGGSISGVDELFAFWKKYGAAFGSDESYAFIKKLRSYNETLQHENKIQFLGIDVVPLITKVPEMLISFLPDESILPPTTIADTKGINQLLFPLDQPDAPFRTDLMLIPAPLDQGSTTDYFQALVFLKDTMIMSNY